MGIVERKEREKEARRDEIIKAAETLFFENGLAATTMDQIAEKAELSKGTLYLYYKSKEDLYIAVIMKGSQLLMKLFESAVDPNAPAVKQIWGLGGAYRRFFRQHRDYFRMYYFFQNRQLHAQVSREMLEACAAQDQCVWTLVISLIERAIEDGQLRNDLTAKQIAVMLWSNAYGLMTQMDTSEDYWKSAMDVDLDDTLRKSQSILFSGLMTERGRQISIECGLDIFDLDIRKGDMRHA